MSERDEYEDLRDARNARANRQYRDAAGRSAGDDQDWDEEASPRRYARGSQRRNDDWDDDEPDPRPSQRRAAPSAEERRDSLMQRRLRAARGDEYDDDYAEPVTRRYTRQPDFPPPYRSGGGGGGGGGCLTNILVFLIACVVMGLLALMFGGQILSRMVGSATNSVSEQVRTIIATPTPSIFDRGGAIKQIQSLSRLETSSFSIERVVEANVQRGDFLDIVLGERLLLIASGNVIAGVDMAKLRDNNVTISEDGKRISIILPPSEIFVSTLDNERTHVYDHQTRIITQITGGENKDLETQTRREAERTILLAACEGDIMQKAATEAERSLEQFLGLLDFEEITVTGTPGACVAPSQSGSATPSTTP